MSLASSLAAVRGAIAARFGWFIHRAFGLSRRVLGPRPTAADGPVAVMCDTFVRYGVAQAAGIRESGQEVVCYWIDRLTDFGDDESERQLFLDWAEAQNVTLVKLPRRSILRLAQHVVWLHRDLARRNVKTLVVQPHIDPRYSTLGFRFPSTFVVHDPRPHTGDYDSHFPAVIRAITRVAELSAAGLMLHSELLAAQLRPSLSRIPRTYIPHGASVAETPDPLPTSPSVVLVGRLMAYKGIDTALAAQPAIRAVLPDARMIIAGSGRMAAQAREAGSIGVELRDRYIPESELHELLGEASVVLLPYKDATQSGVGLLAVARGIPCVVTAVGALPDLVPAAHPEWVARAADGPDVARAVVSALSHSAADRDEVLALARSEFAWPVVGAQLLEFAKSVAWIK